MYESFRKKQKPIAEINVVPYIDVMLVLLVIFMITTPLLKKGITIKIPSTQYTKSLTAEMPIILSINRDGQYYLNISKTPKKAITEAQLITAIKNKLNAQDNKQLPVYIRADENIPYKIIVQGMSALKQAGAIQIALVTKMQK